MASRDDNASVGATPPPFESNISSGAPPTFAAFSPVTLSSNTPSRSSRRSTILVHQKSPLLLATPPQITRALAYSHPFLLPLNTFVGLLTWTTGDPWQSFLLLCAFWATVLYGDAIVKWAGPVVVGAALIGGMYGRRYSPLSSSGWSEPARELKDTALQAASAAGIAARGAKSTAADRQSKHMRGSSEATNTKHQKTLDEIVDTLKELTGRCNVLLEPLLEMTDFLSTQRTPTSATTRPALTAMFMRLLIVTPFWVLLTLPPLRILTTRRVVLVAGTLVLTWHAKVMRVTRAVLWRSKTIRRAAEAITGLHFQAPVKFARTEGETKAPRESELSKALRQPSSLHVNHRRTGSAKTAGVKFTFIIYENQRRWVGLGWTTSLFAYERSAWTDEHNNQVPHKDEFELPSVEDGGNMRWRWVEGSRWRVDGVPDDHDPVDYETDEAKNGWIYYDSKWQNGRRGVDGWGRWTRRRKWYRDAELAEVDQNELIHELDSADPKATASTTALDSQTHTANGKVNDERMAAGMRSEPALLQVDGASSLPKDDGSSVKTVDSSSSVHSTPSRSFFRPPSLRRRPTNSSIDKERERKENRPRRQSEVDNDDASGLGIDLELEIQKQDKEGGRWGIADEARMSLE
ncbi:integral peroxisomal membrane peroxin-domain-containing protein [Stachybotrys elegans]|uniref:Integral peroxisomal membrane peroxin-domain-containing protein n=1 Tax=Stachybotrys elegans TaxID=80388 RepID=A0A8K0SJU5_9HYPO|nr:integral peroxisomal membrane peroxin-domain-containing protein [Stachybotrys elegans]